MPSRTFVALMLVAALAVSCRDDTNQLVTQASLPAITSTQQVQADATPASSNSLPATTSPLDVVRRQLAIAASEVCAITSAENVRISFRETAPLGTQPMGEASGPACGYPHPRQGGYLLVIQFQEPTRWGAYAQAGQVVRGLGRDAVVTGTTSPQLNVLDNSRSAVIVFLAPDPQPRSLDALLEVAAFAYGVLRADVRVGE
jgi:hypothetical protein